MIPEPIVEICDYLASSQIKMTSPFADGRVNASVNEDEVLKIIKTKFDIVIPRSRNWFDFAIETKKTFYPVNIKITDTTHADNLNCKFGKRSLFNIYESNFCIKNETN